MKTLRLMFMIVTVFWAAAAGAADSTERTYADPACSARDVNPERCVLQDGPRRNAVATQNPAAVPARSAAPANAAPPAG